MKHSNFIHSLSRSTYLTRPRPTTVRLLRTTRAAFYPAAEESERGKDQSISQGHSLSSSNRQNKSVGAEYAHAGFAAAKDPSNINLNDTASSTSMQKPPRDAGESGNPEGIGFAEQVGSQSALAYKLLGGGHAPSTVGPGSESGAGAEHWECEEVSKSESEEAVAPGLFSAFKQSVSLKTSAGDVKQNAGAGGGVTGTGTFTSKESSDRPGDRRSLSTLPLDRMPGASERQHLRYCIPEGEIIVSVDGERLPFYERRFFRIHLRVPGIGEDAETPSGDWHNAGVPGSAESNSYMHVDREDPYDPPGAERDLKLRYGGRKWKVEAHTSDEA
ncbi:hypothetical protein EW146_g1353 [Bondarzewia mesenterica]|uniref:Uncharacterized protein n=1 Tax=Bondarzewia mesenterica TaxID=1095465 RepID=A0A4S4M608_9AGAM|nr:hypothetical protein EW146_g1353 [Bondarzewia mesenterica]